MATMDFAKYENKLPYAPTTDAFAEEESALRARLDEIKTLRKEARRIVSDAYHAEGNRLQEQFKADLFDDLGITDNPHRERLFSKAYEMGHSGGYSEIYSAAANLVDLVQ